jgi:hypothetical protein
MAAFRTAHRTGAFLIPIALVLAACGSGSSASGTPAASGGTSETAATPTPAVAAPSTEASEPATSALPIPSFDIGAIMTGLQNLDSYRVTMSNGGVEKYKAVVVTKPVLARDMTINGDTRIVVIGPDTWVGQNGAPLTKVPEAMATGLFAAFDPSLIVGAFSGAGWAESSLDQGVEQKNGVSAHHYHIDSTTLVGGFTGLPAGATVDVWIAEDGYLVAFESVGTKGGDYSIEVTGVNDPANVVETPS